MHRRAVETERRDFLKTGIKIGNMNTLLKLKLLRGSSHKEKISRRHLRDASDCINLPDSYLLKNCGVNRTVFHRILIILEPVVPPTQRSNGIPFPLKASVG